MMDVTFLYVGNINYQYGLGCVYFNHRINVFVQCVRHIRMLPQTKHTGVNISQII